MTRQLMSSQIMIHDFPPSNEGTSSSVHKVLQEDGQGVPEV